MIEKVRGVKDFYPEDQYGRRKIYGILQNTAQRYGFREVCTPSIENLELITKKSGQAIVDEMYAFKDKGEREICLIPELTPSIVRMFVQRQKELTKPIKWFSLSRHWRYERPQKGRQREFYQFNVDILGPKSPKADFEVIACGIDLLTSLGLKNFQFRISDRNILDSFFKSHNIPSKEAFWIVDKRSKIPKKEFSGKMKEIGVEEEAYAKLEKLLSIHGTVKESLPTIEKEVEHLSGEVEDAIKNLGEVGAFLEYYGFDKYCTIDLSIVRGLAYYTDIVFEVFDRKKSMRSLFGGGRYDNLVSLLGGQKTPAVGFAMGIPMLEIMMKEEGTWPQPDLSPDYFVITIGNVKKTAFELIRHLRNVGTAEYDLSGKNLSNQMGLANTLGAKKVVIVGEKELKQHIITIKDMKTGIQEKMKIEEFYQK
ncbi:MAG: histidine--tRNA ligase [Candidatus Methanofastidiosia archaeon]